MLRTFLSRALNRAVVCEFIAQTPFRCTLATLPPDRPKANPKGGRFDLENYVESEHVDEMPSWYTKRVTVLPKGCPMLEEGAPGGFTEAMMAVTDLIEFTEPLMRITLNEALEDKGLREVEFVGTAIFRLRNKYVTLQERGEIAECLNTVFFGDNSLRDQWETCWRWKMKRITDYYPPVWRTQTELRALKSDILAQEEYSAVREAAVLMVDLLMAAEHDPALKDDQQ